MRLLAEYEPVNIFAGGREVMDQAKSLVGDLKNVTLHDIPTNDSWCRDHGPTFLSSTLTLPNLNPNPSLPPALVDWDYNAWGGKYPPFDLDNEVPRQIAELQDRRRFVPGHHPGRRRDRRQRRRLHPHHQIVPAKSQSQSAARSSAEIEALSARLSWLPKKCSG